MNLTITLQERNSRGELLLRTLFGWIYILVPHLFLLVFISIWNSILDFVKFWVVLFTGKIPQSIYEFQKKLWQWKIRLMASVLNMRDGYPAIGIGANNPDATIEFENPEKVSRSLVLIRVLFGSIYVGFPHGILLSIIGIAVNFVVFISWWIILFAGVFPSNMHDFLMYYIRWSIRVELYMSYYSDDYPPFHGRE